MNAVGILDMDVCYINTQSQKDQVIEQAGKTFNVNFIRKLNKIIKVFPTPTLPVKTEKTSIFDHDPLRIIVFNHQPDKQKSFPLFDWQQQLHVPSKSLVDKLFSQWQELE